MKEPHRVKNGLNEWNHVPPGYQRLTFWDKIQAGDVLRINEEYYVEYPANGLLVKLGAVVSNCVWYRKTALLNSTI